jgi:hypothetical protein
MDEERRHACGLHEAPLVYARSSPQATVEVPSAVHQVVRQNRQVAMPASPRRQFLRDALKGFAQAASDSHALLTAARNPGVETAVLREVAASPAAHPTPGPMLAAPDHMAKLEDVAHIAHQVGLGHRLDDILALAQPSIRLVPTVPESATGASHLGGRPSRVDQANWPRHHGRRLPLLAEIDLAALDAGTLPSDALASGGMALFCDVSSRGGSGSVAHVALIVSHDEATAGAAITDPDDPLSVALRVCPEMVLPRLWTSRVQQLELSPAEGAAWERLRTDLASLQGTEPWDLAPATAKAHRMLGYPDEKTGDMPLACELLARGHDLHGEPPAMHPEARAAEPMSAQWRLLLQLDIAQAIPSIDAAGQVFVWVRDADLRAGQVTPTYAFIR